METTSVQTSFDDYKLYYFMIHFVAFSSLPRNIWCKLAKISLSMRTLKIMQNHCAKQCFTFVFPRFPCISWAHVLMIKIYSTWPSQNIVIYQWLADQQFYLSLPRRHIADLITTDKSQDFVQSRPTMAYNRDISRNGPTYFYLVTKNDVIRGKLKINIIKS